MPARIDGQAVRQLHTKSDRGNLSTTGKDGPELGRITTAGENPMGSDLFDDMPAGLCASVSLCECQVHSTQRHRGTEVFYRGIGIGGFSPRFQ